MLARMQGWMISLLVLAGIGTSASRPGERPDPLSPSGPFVQVPGGYDPDPSVLLQPPPAGPHPTRAIDPPSHLPQKTRDLLKDMLPLRQLGILPGQTVIEEVDADVYPLVITVTRAGFGQIRYRLYREGSEEDGTHRFQLDHGSRAFPPLDVRPALLQLLRDKEGAFHWTEPAVAATPAPIAAPVTATSVPGTPATAQVDKGTHAARWLAAALVALMAWAVLWKRRADGKGQGS